MNFLLSLFRYRPLTGMSCNICSLGYDQLAQMFPSPCGDKL